jgi:hypothetical protein
MDLIESYICLVFKLEARIEMQKHEEINMFKPQLIYSKTWIARRSRFGFHLNIFKNRTIAFLGLLLEASCVLACKTNADNFP